MRLDPSNLISAGFVGYVQSLQRFDPSRGVKFKTFAEYRIKGAVFDEVRKTIGDERCKHKRPIEKVHDLSTVSDNNDGHNGSEARYEIKRFLEKVHLTSFEKEVLQYKMMGLNAKEISEKTGKSLSLINIMLSKIKEEIKKYCD
jgi:RNA polymerase sigma factor (sigma-70 family)